MACGYGDSVSYENLVLRYVNEKNEVIEEKKDGYEARVLQHEIDHLDGILFVDYLKCSNILYLNLYKFPAGFLQYYFL